MRADAPDALRTIRTIVYPSMPCSAFPWPLLITVSHFASTAKAANGIVKRHNCTLRTHSDGGATSFPLTSASKYTPANDESDAAHKAAITPSRGARGGGASDVDAPFFL